MLETGKCLTDPPLCSQSCVHIRPSGYQCSCVDGYQLASDRHRCVVASWRWKTWKYPTALVFYSQSGRIISRTVRPGGGSMLVYRATGLVSALGRSSRIYVPVVFIAFDSICLARYMLSPVRLPDGWISQKQLGLQDYEIFTIR